MFCRLNELPAPSTTAQPQRAGRAGSAGSGAVGSLVSRTFRPATLQVCGFSGEGGGFSCGVVCFSEMSPECTRGTGRCSRIQEWKFLPAACARQSRTLCSFQRRSRSASFKYVHSGLVRAGSDFPSWLWQTLKAYLGLKAMDRPQQPSELAGRAWEGRPPTASPSKQSMCIWQTTSERSLQG